MGGGGSGGSGGMAGFMSGRAAGDLLTRTTAILATCFFLTSFVLAILILLLIGDSHMPAAMPLNSVIIWLHVFAGIIWIGLLYYFNFVQVPALADAINDDGEQKPLAIRFQNRERLGKAACDGRL